MWSTSTACPTSGRRGGTPARPPRLWHLREILPPGPRRRFFARRLRRFGGPSGRGQPRPWPRGSRGGAGRGASAVVPNGVDAPPASPRARRGARARSAFAEDGVGRLPRPARAATRASTVLVDAFAAAPRGAPELRLVVAGERPARRCSAALGDASRAAGRADRVHPAAAAALARTRCWPPATSPWSRP